LLTVWYRALRPKTSKKAKIAAFPNNACRHTFISMHVAFRESIEKTALEADTSPEIIKSNYLDIVTRDEAANFWVIYPKK
jgi:hypothetical protein